VLQAVRFAEADALMTQRAELERELGPAALPAEIRAALEAADGGHDVQRTLDELEGRHRRDYEAGRPADTREITLDEAAAVLSQAVQEHHAVILGEEHPHPEHRALGARLIPRLRTAGITHLALEANAQVPLDDAARSGRIVPSTDFFAFEPRRAALLRAALTAGLPLVAFEPSGDNLISDQAGAPHLVDWESARVAPPERDLAQLDLRAEALASYLDVAGGPPPHPDILRLYRLWYDLAESAVYVMQFPRAAHRRRQHARVLAELPDFPSDNRSLARARVTRVSDLSSDSS